MWTDFDRLKFERAAYSWSSADAWGISLLTGAFTRSLRETIWYLPTCRPEPEGSVRRKFLLTDAAL
jgi:hypothetical protein